MKAFLYGLVLQLKMDIRSKALLVTCYIVPLIFFVLMGSIFISVMPEMKKTLIPSMIVMGVSMGAFIGLPPTLIETFGSDVKKVYVSNGVPLSLCIFTMAISTFVHLMMMSCIIVVLAPLLFQASFPSNKLSFLIALAIYIIVSLSIGCVLGLVVKSQAKLTMIAQLVFLPSIMLSGIMFPIELLPNILRGVGKLFPAYWGYQLMLDHGLKIKNLWVLIILLVVMIVACKCLLENKKEN